MSRRLSVSLASAGLLISTLSSCKFNTPASTGQSSGTSAAGANAAPAAALAGFLTAADLTPGPVLTQTAAQDLLNDLQRAAFLYANLPLNAVDKNCLDPLTDAIPLKATASGIQFSAVLDVKACASVLANTGAGLASYAITSSQLKIALILNCQGGGTVAGFNGKKYSDLKPLTLGALCPQASLQWETDWTTNASYSVASTTGMPSTGTFTKRITNFQGGDNLGFCQMTTTNGQLRRTDGCVAIYHAVSSSTPSGGVAAGTEDYRKLTAVGVVQEATTTALWPISGSVNVLANNWTGTIAFQGTQVGPIATLTSTGAAPLTTRLTAPTP